MAKLNIAIDMMGGDQGLAVTVPGVLLAHQRYPDVHLILVGDAPQIEAVLKQNGVNGHPCLNVWHASQQVMMDESPTSALRHKKDSSMRVAINLVNEGKANACVSAGNTGALMATAKFVLNTIPGIERPAILSPLPTINSKEDTYVLDLGANVDCKAEHLFQFAIMGSVTAAAIKNKTQPTVGLLNIGHEAIKGNEFVRQVATLLQQCTDLNYTGFVEADDIFSGKVDVVVCDGFVGNVALKAMEGSARLIVSYLKQAFMRNSVSKIAGKLLSPILRDFKKRSDPSSYNGASLIGLNGVVIKSHGGANALAFSYAIQRAIIEAQHNVPVRISAEVKKILQKEALP